MRYPCISWGPFVRDNFLSPFGYDFCVGHSWQNRTRFQRINAEGPSHYTGQCVSSRLGHFTTSPDHVSEESSRRFTFMSPCWSLNQNVICLLHALLLLIWNTNLWHCCRLGLPPQIFSITSGASGRILSFYWKHAVSLCDFLISHEWCCKHQMVVDDRTRGY